jgi:N-acetylneuraminic acid mutarotase
MGEDSEMKRTHTPQDVEKIQNRWKKVSIRTVENTIGLARSVANGTTKFPFMGYCADLMEKMLEEIKEARKAQEK